MLIQVRTLGGYETWLRPNAILSVGQLPSGTQLPVIGVVNDGYAIHMLNGLAAFVDRENALKVVRSVNSDMHPGEDWRLEQI